MARTSDAPTGGKAVPFPRYSIGLLQSESEMLQAPAYDLSAFLAAEQHPWTVELFTERTVQSLLDATTRFDCIVVGYNAAYISPEIGAALEAWTPDVGLCVLHQFNPAGLGFLRPLGLTARQIGSPTGPPCVAEGRTPHDEILLNYPDGPCLTEERPELADSIAYVSVSPTNGDWRTVLELELPNRRLPVLVRTHTERRPPLAVCTTLLAPRHETHAQLLTNLILWCASGQPSAVVIGTGTGSNAAAIQRKLRMQGARAIVEDVATPEELDFRSWPFWGVTDVVLPPEWDPGDPIGPPQDERAHHRSEWLRRGGRIVVLGPGDSLTIRHGESDAHWVVARWATWFNSVAASVWHGGRPGEKGSLVATRSILRMLSVVHRMAPTVPLPGQTAACRVLDQLAERGIDIDPAPLGLPKPTEFVEPVGRLLRQRIGRADNVDETVSATIAALDIDALLGGQALDEGRRRRLEGWLTKKCPTFAIEDQLEVARCLGRPKLLERVIAAAAADSRSESPASATLVTALRSALVACKARPEAVTGYPINVDRQVVERELPTRPMLAANYILGVLDLQSMWSEPVDEQPARSLRDPPAERLDQAVVTLGRYGPLARGHGGSTPPVPQLASTEALALIAYFANVPVPTHVLRREQPEGVPMGEAVLEESSNLRSENELRLADARVLRWATPTLAALALLVVLELLALVWWQLLSRLPIGLELTFAGLLFVVMALVVLLVFESLGLKLKGSKWVADVLADGWKGVRTALAAAIGRRAGPEADD